MSDSMMNTKQPWWKDAVIYQIYPRSFADSNGDGIGDLPGIISKLDYLAELGIDAIWLSPVFRSPQDDNGYDISDYQDIDPMFGSLSDMENLIREAKKRNIRIIMDLVLSHSSDEHFWFREAKKSRDNPYHDFYIWRDGEPGTPPNDMESAFGGSAWEWVPEVQQYYFHQFSVKQADLNWENPKLRQTLYAMICWWVEKGVGGFRLDVVDFLGKEPDRKIVAAGPKLHDYLREMSREAFRKEDLVTVGEAWSATPETAKLFSNPDGSELSMVFQFEHICLDQEPGKDKWDVIPLSLPKLKDCYRRWQQELHGEGWNSLFLNNHDLPRTVSRWGNDKEYRVESAKMLTTMLHGMQGTPYIFQGEELGMTNIKLPMEEHVDIETLNVYEERISQGYDPEEVMNSINLRSRDNARTPMQWTAGEKAGFTTGNAWMPINPNYTEINVEAALADPDSVFYYYQKLISLRKTLNVFREGDFDLLYPDDENIFAYIRKTREEQLLVVCNFSDREQTFDVPEAFRGAQKIISNYSGDAHMLRPYEAFMLHCLQKN